MLVGEPAASRHKDTQIHTRLDEQNKQSEPGQMFEKLNKAGINVISASDIFFYFDEFLNMAPYGCTLTRMSNTEALTCFKIMKEKNLLFSVFL